MIVEWSPRARRELIAQLHFIALDKPTAADRMSMLVEDHVQMLQHWPRLGKPTRRPDYFELVIPRTPFFVVYRLSEETITVALFARGSQNVWR